MEVNQSELLEQKLNRIATMAGYLQCAGIFAVVLIIYFKPLAYKEIGQSFALSALVASFIISRVYIHTGKKLETFKTFQPDEGDAREREYFVRFFSPYILWCGCIWFFSSL